MPKKEEDVGFCRITEIDPILISATTPSGKPFFFEDNDTCDISLNDDKNLTCRIKKDGSSFIFESVENPLIKILVQKNQLIKRNEKMALSFFKKDLEEKLETKKKELIFHQNNVSQHINEIEEIQKEISRVEKEISEI